MRSLLLVPVTLTALLAAGAAFADDAAVTLCQSLPCPSPAGAASTNAAVTDNPVTDSNQAISAGSAFNPAISLILSGNFYKDSESGKLIAPAGINNLSPNSLPPPAMDQGFNLDESELVLSATVDPEFDASANFTLDNSGHVEVEEAWFETRQLPYGLTVRAGKMKSDIGYLNSQHPHTWDFADQNLAYDALLGGEGIDDAGLRVEWLPSLPLYTLIGGEALQGNQDVVGVSQAALGTGSTLNAPSEKSGPRLFTAYIKVSPELGANHALELGAWGLRAQQQQEAYGTPGANQYLLNGTETIYGLEAVYKYDGGGENGHGNLKLQAEALRGQKNLSVASLSGAPVFASGAAVADGDNVNSHELAYYVQAVYGIAPRWQTGLRFDQSGLGSALSAAGTNTDYSASKRVSAVVSWNLTEFSRLRAQIARADAVDASNVHQHYNQYFLTYSMALGTHGAHKF